MNRREVTKVLRLTIDAIASDHRQPICIHIRNFGSEEMHQWLKPYMERYKPYPGKEGYWFGHLEEDGRKRINILKSLIEDMETTYTILGYTVIMEKKNYADNKRIAIQFIDIEDGSPVAMATVNLPDVELEEDEVAIKDWSENNGILGDMVKAGIVSNPIRYEKAGWAQAPICKLLK